MSRLSARVAVIMAQRDANSRLLSYDDVELFPTSRNCRRKVVRFVERRYVMHLVTLSVCLSVCMSCFCFSFSRVARSLLQQYGSKAV